MHDDHRRAGAAAEATRCRTSSRSANDAETVAAAKTIGAGAVGRPELRARVLPDPARHLPDAFRQPASLDAGAARSVEGARRRRRGHRHGPARPATGVVVQVRLIDVATGRVGVREGIQRDAQEPRQPRGSTRTRSSDEIHQQQRALNGVARTKLAFTSDRDGERMKGPVGDRGISNIYIADYDGANQTRITVTKGARHRARVVARPQGDRVHVVPHGLSRTSSSPYSTSRRVTRRRRPARPRSRTSCRRGRRTARSSRSSRTATATRRSTSMNRDGSGLRRLTNHPEIDVTPTWSPSGQPDRLHVQPHRQPADLDHERRRIGRAADHAASRSAIGRPGRRRRSTRSPTRRSRAPASTSRSSTSRRGRRRPITDGIGSNESPAFSPNGRHVAFTSTRAGKEQIFTDRPRRQEPPADHADRA